MTLLLFVALFWMPQAPAIADPLEGSWILNPARSRYGAGAEPRSQENFDCASPQGRVTCTLHSIRPDGRSVTARFTAGYDGKAEPVTGMPDVDAVALSRIDDSIVDATFSFRGTPVFAYRAIKSSDRRSLTIVSVEPITRRVLTSVVVYDRRR